MGPPVVLVINSVEDGDEIDYVGDINVAPEQIRVTYKLDGSWKTTEAAYSRPFENKDGQAGTATFYRQSGRIEI